MYSYQALLYRTVLIYLKENCNNIKYKKCTLFSLGFLSGFYIGKQNLMYLFSN